MSWGPPHGIYSHSSGTNGSLLVSSGAEGEPVPGISRLLGLLAIFRL